MVGRRQDRPRPHSHTAAHALGGHSLERARGRRSLEGLLPEEGALRWAAMGGPHPRPRALPHTPRSPLPHRPRGTRKRRSRHRRTPARPGDHGTHVGRTGHARARGRPGGQVRAAQRSPADKRLVDVGARMASDLALSIASTSNPHMAAVALAHATVDLVQAIADLMRLQAKQQPQPQSSATRKLFLIE